MASELDSLWGGEIVGAGAAADNVSEAGSTRSRASSKAAAKQRAGRGKAKGLSPSFTSWQSTPEPGMTTYQLCPVTVCGVWSNRSYWTIKR